MIINISDVWEDAKHGHLRYHSALLRKAIKILRFAPPQRAIEHSVANFLEINFVALLTANSKELPNLIGNFNVAFTRKKDRMEAFKMLRCLINYDSFSKKAGWRKKEWCAYKLCSYARYVICPYCHISPIDTKLPDPEADRGYRPNLDHYYSKDDYPYLALTLCNLIPSCERCNGPQCKHKADFGTMPHLNPLSDLESVRFELNLLPGLRHKLQGTLSHTENSSQYVIELHPCGPDANKVKNSITTFGLTARYALVVDQIFRLRRQLRTLSSRRKMAAQAFPDLKTELADTVGFETDDNSYKRVMIGKLRLDLFRQTCEENPQLIIPDK